MHVNLGKPYELIMEKAIKEGYASSQTEVLRQALMGYKEKLFGEEYIMTPEEEKLVAKAVEKEMQLVKDKKIKTYKLEDVKKELGIPNEL
jgi:Arc/MetJ-type ribon-helix-helix transcriptional regulator